MHTREMNLDDIEQALIIRTLAIKDSKTIITADMLTKALLGSCKGFVAIVDNEVIGFVLANRKNKEIWGIFILPEYQERGAGRALLLAATGWLFSQRYGFFYRPISKITLTCTCDSKEEKFYLKQGWSKGRKKKNERIMYIQRPSDS